MSKNFVKIIFVVALFVGTFFVTDSVSSATKCCDIKKGYTESSVNFINECRLEGNTSCQTVVKNFCDKNWTWWNIIPAYYVFSTQALAVECGTAIASGGIYFQEVQVDCTSNDRCMDALIPKCCLIEAVPPKDTPTDCRLKGNDPCGDLKTCFFDQTTKKNECFFQKETEVECAGTAMCRNKVTAILIKCGEFKDPTRCSESSAACFWSTNRTECLSVSDVSMCPGFAKEDCGRVEGCKWEGNDTDGQCLSPLLQGVMERYGKEDRGLFRGCAFSGTCRNLSDILYTILQIVKEIFKYIGAIAFIFFIFGGFTMILSFGNSEKFKKGQQILVAAVIGLVIVFGAYLMITFVLEALGVSAEFKAIK